MNSHLISRIAIRERELIFPGSGMELLADRNLIIASNRGPVKFKIDQDSQEQYSRSGGGLVTALTGLARNVPATWIASAQNDGDRAWGSGELPIGPDGAPIRVRFLSIDSASYHSYYNVIANPLLWFLQHNMWDMVHAPTIDHSTWEAWENGYVKVNRLFAQAISEEIRASERPSLVMLQDYHLYLVPRFVREILSNRSRYTLLHFIHIPWPGTEDWGILPPKMRRAILEGLCSADLVGFQTQEDGLNFIRSCESHLPRSHVTFKLGRIWYRNHAAYVRDFPISIDVQAIKKLAESEEVKQYRQELVERFGNCKLVIRIDRLEPSKNIIRGFLAFNEMLELHPEHIGKVQFLAFLVPSRMKVEEYQKYLEAVTGVAGRINAIFGTSEWEPIRVFVGESYERAIAALQIYDVLLVNSIADGMNLVAKEGPTVNDRHGVLVLSDRTGARQQLDIGALIISPCDIYATAEALHQALEMPEEERRDRATRLQQSVEREDINQWLCQQLDVLAYLNL